MWTKYTISQDMEEIDPSSPSYFSTSIFKNKVHYHTRKFIQIDASLIFTRNLTRKQVWPFGSQVK